MMELEASITITFKNDIFLNSLYRALYIESISLKTERSFTTIHVDGKNLILVFHAKDITALRAALNSYLRMLYAVIKVLTVIDNVKRRGES